MQNKIRLTLTLCILGVSVWFQQISGQVTSQKALTDFINTKGLEHASIGFCIKDFSGKVILEHNANKSYTPASILKVVTTASAIEVLGANYNYETVLAKDVVNPNRLLIFGSGDPTLGSEHTDQIPFAFLDLWVNQVNKYLPTKERLDILVVDNYLGYSGVSRKWVHEDIGNYYAAAAYGISVFDNTYRLTFNTEHLDKGPQIVGTEPQMKDLKFTNTLKLNTTGQDNGYIIGTLFSNERTIIGDIPGARKKFTIKGDIPDPGLYLGNRLADRLRAKGVAVNTVSTTRTEHLNAIYEEQKPIYRGTPFYVHQSPPLSQIIRVVNEKSNNHYAEHLIRTIGRAKNSDIYSLPLEEGIEKIKEVWKSKGLDTSALFMYDGCGLAPSNAVSPEFMCDVLIQMQKSRQDSLQFNTLLPQAGREGTVKNFLKGTTLSNYVFVKSGSISDVQCYAGYYINGEKKYAFTIMVNQFTGQRRPVINAIEKLLIGTLN